MDREDGEGERKACTRLGILSQSRNPIDAPVIARTANPDATRNSLNRLSRSRGKPRSWRLEASRSMCDVVASWSNGGHRGVATCRWGSGAKGTAEEAELSLLLADNSSCSTSSSFHAYFPRSSRLRFT